MRTKSFPNRDGARKRDPGLAHDRRLALAVCVTSVLLVAAVPARAMDMMYAPSEIQRDAPRLKRAVERIYRLGIAPKLTRDERRRLGKVTFRFPPPQPDSAVLNFYAYQRQTASVVVMPLLSLKQLEDLMTAYAWLQQAGMNHSTIDLYFAALRRRPKHEFPNQNYPDILSALGVPKNANDDKRVDVSSLGLRNEAIAFVLAHELAHILYRHKPYSQVSAQRARADELESDRFAHDVLVRTNTPPMGALLFFQAQAYAMPHRGEYATEQEWRRYLRKFSTHPLSTERITLLAHTIGTAFAARRPGEAATWRSIADLAIKMKAIVEDVEVQRCIAKSARTIPLARLKPTTETIGIQACQTAAGPRN